MSGECNNREMILKDESLESLNASSHNELPEIMMEMYGAPQELIDIFKKLREEEDLPISLTSSEISR